MDKHDEKRAEFLEYCELKHKEGSLKYGDTWKHTQDKDWTVEILAELADAVNYITFLAIKIQKLKEEAYGCPSCKVGILEDDVMTEEGHKIKIRSCPVCGFWR